MTVSFAIIIDLLSGIVCTATFLVASIQQYRLYRKYPFQGLKIFSWGFFLSQFPIGTVVLILTLRVFGLAVILHEFLVLLYKVTFIIGVIGIGTFVIGLIILNPISSEKTLSLPQILVGSLVGFCAGIIFTTLDFYWLTENTHLIPPIVSTDFRYGGIYIDYPIILSLGLVILVSLLVIIAFQHIRRLQAIQAKQKHPLRISTKWVPIAYISVIIAFILLLISRLPVFQEYSLALTFAIPLVIGGFAFSMTFIKRPSFLAITSARLNSLIIIDPDGRTLYAFDFKDKMPSYDNVPVLLGGMLSALNISLSETLQSATGLSSIALGDKQIMIHSTSKFVVYLISSEINPTISDLIKLYAKRFSELYSQETIASDIIDQETFLPFTKIVIDLVQFAPLSM